MNAPVAPLDIVESTDAEAILANVAGRLPGGSIVPYLGPGLAADAGSKVPMTPETLADFFGQRVALPRRARGNVWASAQHIESAKHRSTVSALMAEAFAPPVPPTALHAKLAGLGLPLIVDTWYDGAMHAALASVADWGEVQGITRAGIGEDRWYRFYGKDGTETNRDAARDWKTALYKPHGSIVPAKNFLISDADYVEVLTEIDIQTPVPDLVKERRTGRAFLFLGCRFHDQLLRTYARQITKRSSNTHFVVVEPGLPTKNELKFFREQGYTPLGIPLARATEIILSVL